MYWNLFDGLIVIMSLLLFILEAANMAFLRVLRVIRTVRVMRAIRIVKVLRELRLMVAQILSSGATLLWAMVLLLSCVFIFSIFLCEMCRGYLREGAPDPEIVAAIETYQTSVSWCMTNLMISILGGRDWYDPVEPMMKLHPALGFLYIFFMSFMLLGMLNILVAVFVESANNLSRMDAELVAEEELLRENSALNRLRAIFIEIDVDKSGMLTWDEMQANLHNPRLLSLFDENSIRITQARQLFRLLDIRDQGIVPIEDFCLGCLRLGGVSKSIDLIGLSKDIHRLGIYLQEILTNIDKEEGKVLDILSSAQGPRPPVPCKILHV
jgi:hypothetical protein